MAEPAWPTGSAPCGPTAHRDQPGARGVPGEAARKRDRHQRRQRLAAQPGDGGDGEGQEGDERGERIAGQPHHQAAVAQPGERLRVPGTAGHAVDEEVGVERGQHGAQVVGGAGSRGAGDQHEVGVGGGERVEEQGAGVGQPDGGRRQRAGSGQEAGEHRTDGVAHPARSGRTVGDQLVPGDQRRDPRARAHRQPVEAERGDESEHGGVDDSARRQQLLARRALLADAAHVLPRGDRTADPATVDDGVLVG